MQKIILHSLQNAVWGKQTVIAVSQSTVDVVSELTSDL